MHEVQLRQVFSTNLRRLLRERNVSQKALSEKLHVSHVQVSRWATGKHPPSWEMVAAICTNLAVPPTELFCGEPETVHADNFTDDDIELFKKFRAFQEAYTKVS